MTNGNEEKKSAIEKVKDKLYSKSGEGISRVKELDLRKKAYDVKKQWEQTVDSEEVKDYMVERRPLFSKILVLSIAFFILAVLVAGALFLFGSNTISTEDVVISVSGPSLVDAGEEINLQIEVLNKNNVRLEDVVLAVRFPNDTRQVGDLNESFMRYEEEVGSLAEGGKLTKDVDAILFGEEGAKKEIVISVEYKIKDSTAVFKKEKLYAVTISSAPIGIQVDSVREITAGHEIELGLNVTSNSRTDIENILIEATYPFGFNFEESDPDADFGNSVWKISKLEPGEQQEITIRGIVEGQDNEERVFRFNTGLQEDPNSKEISTVFFSVLHPIQIVRSALDLAVQVDGSREEEIAIDDDKFVNVDIAWKNNSTVQIVDASVVVELSGSALEKQNVESGQGFYRSNTNTIEWNKDSVRSLGVINPGDSGQVSFQIAPGSLISGSEIVQDPQINIKTSIRGPTPSDDGGGRQVNVRAERVLKVNTNPTLSAKIIRSTGPFENNGPIPPVAEEETSYTVSWSISNTTNDILDAVVRAKLPEYAEWTNAKQSSHGEISYNPETREVVWNMGKIARGVGFTSPVPEGFFQIVFTPSVSQIGDAPVLLGESKVSGEDDFTGKIIGASFRQLDTRFTSDPEFESRDERVVE